MNPNLWLLAAAQGLFLTNNVVFIAVNGLVGLSLAPAGWMATLPVMGYVVGGALSTGLVARSQARWGRKVSFQLGLAVALLSALACAAALHWHSFWLLVASTLVAGYYSANGQLYRFAAGELAAPAFREKAVSLVLAGGLIGAIAGPNLAQQTRDSLGTPFLAAYLALAFKEYKYSLLIEEYGDELESAVDNDAGVRQMARRLGLQALTAEEFLTDTDEVRAVYRGEPIDLQPTSAMRAEAQRGLDWREQFGRGGTGVAVRRAQPSG